MAKANQSKYMILGLLSFWPMSGYDIKYEIETSTTHFWTISYTQIYNTLKQLEADSFVTKSIEKTDGRPDKKVYTLTAAGRDHLHEWLLTPAPPAQPKDESSLKLFFGHEISPAENIQQIEAYRAELNNQMASIAALAAGIEQWYATDGPHRQHPNYVLLTVQKEQHILQAQLNWCDNTINYLNEWKI